MLRIPQACGHTEERKVDRDTPEDKEEVQAIIFEVQAIQTFVGIQPRV